VSDISGRIPMFGYPLMSFEEKDENDPSPWSKISKSIVNPNVNNKNLLCKELLMDYYKYRYYEDFIF